MKANLTLVAIVLLLALITGITLFEQNKVLKENNTLQNNQIALLDSMARYKVQDSLNAVQARVLSLSLDDYKKHRASDAKLIAELKTKLANASNITKVETKTKYEIKTQICDSIVHDTIKASGFKYKSKWTDISGYLVKDSIRLKVENRESLKIVQSIEYKRFLGFLWKTNKIKKQTIDVISENPNTIIENVECIQIIR